MNAGGTKIAAERRLALALLTGLSALMLVVALSLWLSRFEVRAEPAADVEAASLDVEKRAMQEEVVPGEVLTYVITVRNVGDEPTVAWLTDTLPDELNYVEDSLSASFGSSGVHNGIITWTAEMVGFNYTAVLTFGARVSAELTYAEIVNTAQVTGAGELVESFASSVAVTDTGNLDTDATTKAVSSTEVEPGDVLTYTIRIANVDGDNPYDVVGARLTDTLPAGLSLISDSLTSDPQTEDLSEENGVITWTNTVAYSSVHEIQFSAQVSEGVTRGEWLTNTVEIASPLQSFSRSSRSHVLPDQYYAYLPLIFRRWPPIPYPPILNSINNPGHGRSYTVTWSYDGAYPEQTEPVTYTLQQTMEPASEDWSLAYEGPNTSALVTVPDNGHYHYRVRGNNEFGPGEWSNIEDVLVWQYDDDFSDYRSGWPREWSDTRGALYRVRPDEHPSCPGCAYEGGDSYLIARRKTSQPHAVFGPGVAVPSNRYEFEVDTRWWDARWGATYQILFGANDSLSEYYAVRVKIDDVIDLCRFSLVRSTDSGTRVLTDGWVDTHEIECGESRDDDTPWNHWRIRRDGDRIRVYVNGEFLGEWGDSTFGANRYFGVRATLYEGFTPSKPEYDNWSVRLLD